MVEGGNDLVREMGLWRRQLGRHIYFGSFGSIMTTSGSRFDYLKLGLGPKILIAIKIWDFGCESFRFGSWIYRYLPIPSHRFEEQLGNIYMHVQSEKLIQT